MKDIPWKVIFVVCVAMAVLVAARCVGTTCITKYYGGTNWMEKIWADPWTYVGIAAAAVALISGVTGLILRKK